ncbi:MAG: hypothetical protein U1F34_07085 [Gammaproteobacteria bacterium]
MSSEFAAFDPQEYQGNDLVVGRSIELLAPAEGLASGRYAFAACALCCYRAHSLLPSKVPVSNWYARRCGRRGPGSICWRCRWRCAQQWIPGSWFSELASSPYNTYSANNFASFAGLHLPRDGGVLQVAAIDNLELGGVMRAAAAAGGRGSGDYWHQLARGGRSPLGSGNHRAYSISR